MNRQPRSSKTAAHITIRVSGKLFQGHLAALDQLVESARECTLWPLLSLAQLEEVDQDALQYLINGEALRFGIIACPDFIRDWMHEERVRAAA